MPVYRTEFRSQSQWAEAPWWATKVVRVVFKWATALLSLGTTALEQLPFLTGLRLLLTYDMSLYDMLFKSLSNS